MPENYKDLDRYQDVLGQLPMLQVYSHVLYLFPSPSCLTDDSVILQLERAITRVRKEVPWMGARVVNIGKGPGNSGTYRVIACAEPTKPIDVRDVRNEAPSYKEFAERRGALSMIDAKQLTPVSAFPARFEDSDTDPAHTVRLQASFIDGGLVLDFVMHHNMADAGGHFGFVKLIAMAMRGEEFPVELLHDANLDRRGLVPLLESEEPMMDHSHHKRAMIKAPTPTPDSAGTPKPEAARHHVFRFTVANMDRLKRLASPDCTNGDGDVPFISTDDAICAFIWQRVSTARAKVHNVPPETSSRFARAIDGRGALGIPANYMGDVIHNVTTFLKFGELRSRPLSSVAASLRRRLNECNTYYHVRSFATFLSREPDKDTITYGGDFNPASDVGCSSIRARKDLFPQFGELGRPVLIRRPPPPPFQGLLVLFPANEANDCDAMLCVSDTVFDALMADPEWVEYVDYIG
jgi:hypothetical protein